LRWKAASGNDPDSSENVRTRRHPFKEAAFFTEIEVKFSMGSLLNRETIINAHRSGTVNKLLE
jgi:hypothetical protein